MNKEALELPELPYIRWLVIEDMNAYIAPFGYSMVATSNLSPVAEEGVVYEFISNFK